MTMPAFDTTQAHTHFSADCFNAAWALIDKAHRTPREDQLLLAATYASMYHWMQRPDCADEQLSIGFWQASRVHAVLGHAAEARRTADVCLSYSESLPPFYKGYAHEALARAAAMAGDAAGRDRHLEVAGQLAAEVTDAEERALLERDLASLR